MIIDRPLGNVPYGPEMSAERQWGVWGGRNPPGEALDGGCGGGRGPFSLETPIPKTAATDCHEPLTTTGWR